MHLSCVFDLQGLVSEAATPGLSRVFIEKRPLPFFLRSKHGLVPPCCRRVAAP